MGIDGTYLQGITTVVHNWEEIDFANYVYSRLRFGRTGGPSVVVNGTPIAQVAGVEIDILIDEKTTFIESRFVLLFGNPKPVFNEYENEISKSSFYFTGTVTNDQLINFGTTASLKITTDLTISIWAKPDQQTPVFDGFMVTSYRPNGLGTGYALLQDSATGGWSFGVGVTTPTGFNKVSGVTPAVAGEWTHLTGVWNDTTKLLKIYVNGIEDGSVSLPAAILEANPGDDFSIGASNVNSLGVAQYIGFLNNCRVWNAALTDDEVLEVFNNGVTYNIKGQPDSVTFPQEASLVSWWKVGDDSVWDGSDWQMPDQIGVNNGTSTSNMGFPSRKVGAPVKFLSE